MKANRRPPETGTRQAGGGRRPANAPPPKERKARLHIAMPEKWKRTIEKAARRQNLGRSNFIAKAAYAAAVADEAAQ